LKRIQTLNYYEQDLICITSITHVMRIGESHIAVIDNRVRLVYGSALGGVQQGVCQYGGQDGDTRTDIVGGQMALNIDGLADFVQCRGLSHGQKCETGQTQSEC